jgi:hypothetical protein
MNSINSTYYTAISHSYGTIGGGASNVIGYVGGATIAGGVANKIIGKAPGGGSINYSTIGGGTGNSIDSGGDLNNAATIAGGAANWIYSSRDATIGGGWSNNISTEAHGATIGGGQGNAVLFQSYGATIAGGVNNRMDYYAIGSVIGGGSDNRVFHSLSEDLSFHGTISGGQSNVIYVQYGTIAGGAQAAARNYGQMAYASGQFATNGDAQTALYVCRNLTTNATQTVLFLDGDSKRMVVPPNTTWAYDVLITGRAANGDSAAYQVRGAIKNNAGTTTLVGTPNVTVLAEDVPAWDVEVRAGDINDVLLVDVTGTAGTSIRWVASVRTVEVTY